MKRTKFIYAGIHVSDIDKSIEFYTKELGMKLLFKTPTLIKETGGKVAWLRSKGSKQILELNWYPDGSQYSEKSGLDHLGFQVDNVEKAYARLMKSHEGVIPPFIEGRWKLAFLKDLDGNWIELGELQKKKKSKSSKN